MAGTLNSVQIIGNLVRDVESKETPNGIQLATFSVATNRVWKDKDGTKHEQAEFHKIVAWAKLAEICHSYMSKGSKVFVRGHLQTASWEDKETQKKMYRTEIVAEDVILLDKKRIEEVVDRSSDLPDDL